jgi:NAD(P)-dependent dehydrogenase (short-subunit alcohol dehydrogenase family)
MPVGCRHHGKDRFKLRLDLTRLLAQRCHQIVAARRVEPGGDAGQMQRRHRHSIMPADRHANAGHLGHVLQPLKDVDIVVRVTVLPRGGDHLAQPDLVERIAGDGLGIAQKDAVDLGVGKRRQDREAAGPDPERPPVAIASIQVNAYPYLGYLSAKAGLNHFTRALAVHFARDGIRANAVLPGVMDTPLIYREIADQHADTEDMLRKRHAASPMGRMGDAWDVAYASLFLASDEAKYITGACLPIDGGKSCWGR